MKLKVAFLLLLILAGENVFAAYNDNSSYSQQKRVMPKSSMSSIVRTSAYDNDVSNSDYLPVINNLQAEIENNPDNYSLYVSLTDAYLNAKMYKEAFNELEKLLELKDNNQIQGYITENIENLKQSTLTNNRYSRNKSLIYLNTALMNLISGSNKQAEQDVKLALQNCPDKELLRSAIALVFNHSENFEEGVSICNMYLALYKNDLTVRKMKLEYLCNIGYINPAIKEYEYILEQGFDIDSGIQYSLFNLLAENKYSNREIMKILLGKDCNDIFDLYTLIYNMLDECESRDKALAYFNKIKKENQNSLKMKFLEAHVLITEGKSSEAIELLNSLKTQLSNDEDIKRYDELIVDASDQPLADIREMMGQGLYEKALNVLESGTIPESYMMSTMKARCYIEVGHLDKAINMLNDAKAVNPDNVMLYFFYALYYFKLDDFKNSRLNLQKAKNMLQNVPDDSFLRNFEEKLNRAEAESYVNQAVSNYENQNYNEAIRAINNGLKIDPNSSQLYMYQGLIYIARNNYAASTASLYKAIDLDESNVMAYYYLGIAFDNLSEPNNAITYYKHFIDNISQDEYGESEKIEYAKSRINKIQMQQ